MPSAIIGIILGVGIIGVTGLFTLLFEKEVGDNTPGAILIAIGTLSGILVVCGGIAFDGVL